MGYPPYGGGGWRGAVGSVDDMTTAAEQLTRPHDESEAARLRRGMLWLSVGAAVAMIGLVILVVVAATQGWPGAVIGASSGLVAVAVGWSTGFVAIRTRLDTDASAVSG